MSKPAPTVEIIATGSELLSGKRLNTNAEYLSQQLSALGFQVIRHETLGDERRPLLEALGRALAETDLVITTGGLGPTLDDITRDVLSEAAGVALEHSEEAAEQIRQRFRQVGKVMPELNLVQAQVPQTGGWFPNPNGTAPGLWFDLGERTAVALPGPPRELNPMFEDRVLPLLAHRYHLSRKLLSKSLSIVAFGESNVEEICRPLIQSAPELTYSILARPGLVEVTLSRWVESDVEADAKLDEMHRRIGELLGSVVFTTERRSLEEVVGQLLRSRGKTLVTAESCTGGLIGESITRVAGSSDYFLGGFIVYSNTMKVAQLGVNAALIEQQGAVSAEVARAMAEGARKRSGADYAVSITGIAGPSGGTPDKPLGLVFIAVADEKRSMAREFRFFGSRDSVRERSRVAALNQLRQMLLELI